MKLEELREATKDMEPVEAVELMYEWLKYWCPDMMAEIEAKNANGAE